MDKAKLIKVFGQVATIAAGVAVGLALHNWAAPRIAKATSQPLKVEVE